MIYVEPEIEKKIIQLHLTEKRSMKSLAAEYGLSEHVVRRIVKNYCAAAKENSQREQELANMEEMGRLRSENEELKKEVEFLKKAAAFFAKESR